MNYLMKKIIPLALISCMGMAPSTLCMDISPFVSIPGDIKGLMMRTTIESKFGAHFEPLSTFKLPIKRIVSTTVLSPDKKTILTAEFNTAFLWNTVTGDLIKEFTGHTNLITDLAFSPDSKTILTGSHDGTARLWDTATGDQLHEFKDKTSLQGAVQVAFSPDSQFVLTTAQFLKKAPLIRLWDRETGKLVQKFKLPNPLLVQQFKLPNPSYVELIGTIAFSPDDKFIAVVAGEFVYDSKGVPSRQGHLLLWDRKTGKLVQDLAAPANSVKLAFSRDNRFIASSRGDALVYLWDRETGKLVHFLKGHSGEVTSVTFSPDSQFVLTGANDGTVTLWDTVTGKELRVFKAQTASVILVAFSADGETMFTFSNDGTLVKWGITWDPNNITQGMTPDATKAAKELFFDKLYQTIGGK